MIRRVYKKREPEVGCDILNHVVELRDAEYSSLAEEKINRLANLLMYQVRHTKQPCLVLDLSRVQFIGARFIGVLVSVWDCLRKQDRRLVLQGLTPFCNNMVRKMGLDKVFEIR
jgi:anti-anti-sigma regulatory factor